MTAERDPELEALLRSALSAEADGVEPGGDGLSRIRARVAGRPSWRGRWATPAFALAAAAAVIAAVAVLPQVLPERGGGGTVPGAAPAGTRSLTAAASSGAAVTVPPTPTGTPRPTSTGTAVPTGPAPTSSPVTTPSAVGSSPAVGELATVWPYASRRAGAASADADVASGKYPHLRDPARTAEDFVASFVGARGLSAERLDAYPPGLRMLVSRDGVPVSTVFLVRVRAADEAPYVVVGASRAGIGSAESLSLAAPPAVRSTDPVTVAGRVRRDAGEPPPTVIVELREPGADEPLAQTTVPVTAADGSWSGVLTPLRTPASTGVVAAWTADADGNVLEFAAAATD